MLVSLYNRLDTYQILSENQKFLYDIINHSGSIIAQKDIEGRYKLVNKKWVEITGFSPNQVLGKTDLEIFPEKTAVQFMKNDSLVLIGKKSLETEEFLETDEGIRYFIASKFPTREKTGQVSGLCAMITEITDRKRIEEAQIQRRKSEAANQAKTEFLSRMSHEIRTPLNAILGFSELLIQSDGLSEKYKKQIYTIWKSGDHLLSLVNDILDFSKIEAGVTEISKSEFSIIELLEGVKMMFVKMAEDKGIHLAFEYPSLENEHIISDEAKLRQIIINLISNAIKFTDKGYVSLSLQINKNLDLTEESSNNHTLKLIVEDSGAGIPEDKREAIFDSFVQLDEGIKAGGTGLGLPITKKLTELLKGNIRVEAKPLLGSKFKVEIPVELSEHNKDLSSTQNEKDTRTDSINRYSSMGYHTQHFIEGLTIDVEILNQMENAISYGDINELNNLILQLDNLPEDLKKTIENLASNFDYRGLIILLERLRNSKKEKNLE